MHSAALAVVRWLSVCPSVRLSVHQTFVYGVETRNEWIYSQACFTVWYRLTILFFPNQTLRQYSDEDTL